MTDNEIMKVSEGKILSSSGKIKAIYPHITVSGDIDKPYYNIDWYDIEKQTMYRGYSSYKLEFVRKWLQEEFEVVEDDIYDLINRQKAEIERLEKENEILSSNADNAFQEGLNESRELFKQEVEEQIKTEAVKEFAEQVKQKTLAMVCSPDVLSLDDYIECIDNLVKEMIGDSQ